MCIIQGFSSNFTSFLKNYIFFSNLRLSMFLRCSYFFAKSEADVLINSVLIKRKACMVGSQSQTQLVAFGWSSYCYISISITQPVSRSRSHPLLIHGTPSRPSYRKQNKLTRAKNIFAWQFYENLKRKMAHSLGQELDAIIDSVSKGQCNEAV